MGGMLTNFQTVKKSIDRLQTLQAWKEDGTFETMTKKEAALAQKEMDKLFRVLKGIAHMPRLPKAIYLIDAKREQTAIQEAARLGIPVVGLVDTNSDPDPIAHVIPGNDDAIRSIQLVTKLLADSILEGHQAYLAGVAERKAAAAAAAAEKAAAEEAAAAAVVGDVAARTIDQVEEIVPESTLKAVIDPAEGKKKAGKE
jgi:small subunit ribosomal protein S2